jgi:hypothetical protein
MKIYVHRHGAYYNKGINRTQREVSVVQVMRDSGSVSSISRVELKAILAALADDMQCVGGVISLMGGDTQ